MGRLHGADFSNMEIVTLAVYLLGGDARHIDTEDIAVKANEIAPGRFTWRKYSDQINLEVVRVYLSDGKKQSKGAYLVGSGSEGWLLTGDGLEFVKSRLLELQQADLARTPRSAKEKQWVRAERGRLLSSEAYQRFISGGIDAVANHQAGAFFRIDEYVRDADRDRKIARIVNAFQDDPELGDAVIKISAKVRCKGSGVRSG